MYNIYNNRHKLLAADLPTTQSNIYVKNEVKESFEHDLAEEISKLQEQMKISYTTVRNLAQKLRMKKYNDSEELKKMKFRRVFKLKL